MSDVNTQGANKKAASPFDAQMQDPKFQALSYEEQQGKRGALFFSNIQGKPQWENLDEPTKQTTLDGIRKLYPPAFTDPRYEGLRQNLESGSAADRFFYSADTQIGMTSLIGRGSINIARALSNGIYNAGSRIGEFFGAAPSSAQDSEGDLMMRAFGGDKDGVKLAKYLQGKYEKVINPKLPMIGGQTPSQLLGTMIGYGTDMAAMKGPVEGVGTLIKGATATAKPILATAATLGGRALTSGAQGIVRGAAAGLSNVVSSEKAPIEGAVDFANGIGKTLASVGETFGLWAAQDLAFGIVGQGAAAGLRRVGGAWLRSLVGKGTGALPNADKFDKVIKGEYSDEAADLQRRFLLGNASPEALAQGGPITRDYAMSIKKTGEYSAEDLMNNPEAQIHFSLQRSMGGQPTPIGIAMNADGPGTFRLRTGLGEKGIVLGEHLSFSEADMVGYDKWQAAKASAESNHDASLARYQQTRGNLAKSAAESYQLRMNTLKDAFPHYRAVQDSLSIIRGNQDRFAPEGAARTLSDGAMLTYGEVGQIQSTGMKTAKISAGFDPKAMGEIAKRGSLLDTDMPTRFSPVTNGDYNGVVIYSRAAPEGVWQVALVKADEFRKAGATSAREDLAQWYLRDQGYDAIAHQGGDVTSLYPRQQVKAVSDMVNKSSREFTTPPERAATGAVPTEQLDEMIAKAKAAHGEDIKLPGVKKSWEESVTVQDGRPTLWYNDAQGGTHAVFADRPTAYKPPSMLTTDADKLDWFVEAATREGGTTLQKTANGVYRLNMQGQEPFHGDLGAVIDQFLVRSTTPAHLRASLEAEGMSLQAKGGQYSIVGIDGKSIGSGASVAEAMNDSHYRPRLLDGRFGPKDIEVLPEGSRFEYSPQGIRGTLSDVYKYAGHFMDVAEAEGRTILDSTKEGRLSQGHDGAYSVEVPSWGIREKFGSFEEAKDYLGGKYKDYDNAQRLANERGFTLRSDPKGFVLTGPTGTFTVHSMEEVGKVLAKNPDPAWAPGGKYDVGVTMKDSADAVKKPVSTAPLINDEGAYTDKGAIRQAISRTISKFNATFMPSRNNMTQLAHEYGHREVVQKMTAAIESLKSASNQNLVDVSKALSLEGNYYLSGKDLRVVETIRQAKDAGLGQEGVERILSENGYAEGHAKRPQILDYADRLKSEYYDKVFERSGQNWDHYMRDYAQRKGEFKAANPDVYRELELKGPEGMRELTSRIYGGRVPDDMHFAALHERVADMESVLSEENATVRAIKYADMANKWTYSAETMKDFYNASNAEGVHPAIRLQAKQFIDQAINGNKEDLAAVFRALGKEGPAGSHIQVLSLLKTMAAMKLYGFKPHSGLGVLEHNYLIGTGTLGTEAMNQGFKRSAEGGDALLQEQYQKNVFTGRATYGFGDTGTAMRDLFSRTFNKAAKAAAYFVSNAHVLGRSGVYEGASWLFDRHVGAWFDSGKVGDFDRVMRQAKGFHLDAGVRDQVEQLIDQGDLAGARHAYAQNMTDQICFTWRPEDQGRALNSGVLSKLWGQLTVVPSHYIAAIGRMVGSGSFLERAESVATFAKNTAAFYGANRLAGLKGANLLPWNVATLRGGPLWQTMVNLTVQPNNSSAQTVAKKAFATLKAMAPVYPQIIQAEQVVKDMDAGNTYGAFLTLTGGSVSPDFQSK